MITRALAIVCLALAALAVLQTYRLQELRNDIAQERLEQTKQTLAAVEAARTEEQRRIAAVQEEADEARKRADQARADAVAARGAAERLRNALVAARAASCKDPAPAATGPAADTPTDLLTELQRRLDDATDEIAGFADQAHAAGRACERAWQKLTPPVESE